ncbi:MAG: TolB family protein, partial [Bacteroidales bacterium]
MSYLSSDNKGLFNVFYTEKEGSKSWSKPRLFSKHIVSRYNDGPVTFSRKNDTIYYSRNLNVEGRLSGNAYMRNKLGIFYSTREGDDWNIIRGMRINNEWYNITAPYLSPDGKRLYFASDNPEGYGGMDLYYISWTGRYWGEPVNLGPVINTEGNEVYPFINQGGELLFASDGHGGLGGKDIFYTRQTGDSWVEPVHVDAPINSEYDDFGFVSDPLINEGYFSSDRDGTFDIYYFKTILPQIFYSNIQIENQYCFTFSDTGSVLFDTEKLQYVWTIGNSDPIPGAVVEYCFNGPGDYDIRLDIVEKSNGRIVCPKLKYSIKLRDIEQPYIEAPEVCVTGET